MPRPCRYRKIGYRALRAARTLEPEMEGVDEWSGAPAPAYAKQGRVEGAL